ncbi:MAG: polyketide synthase, partial [Planctomycetaceae bacterium]|nr:polyketide synthase [Planctomycetaceae bacterium]
MVHAADIPLAIVGMSARLPGAETLDDFWKLLIEGRTELGELPPERFNPALAYDPHKSKRNRSYTKLGGITENRPFNRDLAPISDELLRHSHAVHLKLAETAAAAFRHAGMDPANPPDCRTGVYIGHTPPSSLSGRVIYARLIGMTAQYLREVPGFDALPAAEREAVIREIVDSVRSEFTDGDPRLILCSNAYHAAGVISEGFRLDGPSMSFDAACASSLRALGHGARALQLGQIDMAVIGGASYCHQDVLVLFSQAQSVSPSGSRPFDNDADGLVAAEGYAVVLLKTLEKAVADGDNILSVIRGIGISSDGKGKSLWAPRKEGQIEAIRRTYRNGLKISDLQFIEMHATSTQVGDATEMSALAEICAGEFPAGARIPVGSVKANVGHTLETAGLASLVKTVLAMQHGVIPPQINVKQLNDTIDWANLPFYVPLEPTRWDRPSADEPRRAAVNAFGIGGLNVHVALEEYVPEVSRRLFPAGGSGTAPPPEQQEPIAIIGMGTVLPGARTVDALWDVLKTGSSIKQEIPADRWDISLGYEADPQKLWRVPARTGGFIDDFEYDWKRHKVPPRQLQTADPLQFMLLDAADQAFRDAGYDKDKPYDRMRTGVVVGTVFCGEFADQLQMGLRLPDFNLTLADSLRKRGVSEEAIAGIAAEYEKALLERMPALIDETGSFTASTLASRITKTFDLMGGATAVDSGDASSMAALTSCIDLLRAGDCDMMICAAGSRSMGYAYYESQARAGQLSTNDVAGPFDADSTGMVPGEGVGVLLLKRLSDAKRDGNQIQGIIHGMGVARCDSLADGFERAIHRGSEAAGIVPGQVSVVEAAASGRPERDAAEAVALLRTYGENRDTPLLLGAASAQFGHTGGASGLVEIQKAIGELNHVQMPALPLAGAARSELQ